MSLPESDKKDYIERYTERYSKYGHSPKTLGWDKGKQDIRFSILTSQCALEGKSILDIGCGFGDLSAYVAEKTKTHTYLGVDIVDILIEEANHRYASEAVRFVKADFLDFSVDCKIDICVASGIFNYRLKEIDNYDYIRSVMGKAFDVAGEVVALDFLSDKVDFTHPHTFHSSPERVLGFAYELTRNVVLRNDYMPFEFSVFLFKDDSFDPADTVFRRYKGR
jgi:SAM-dependent methyltransferase